MEEFDIEKVESLDFDKLSSQLKYIFKEEQDCVNFVNFLKNIHKFVNLSNDKRHVTLMELGYFKSQLGLFEKKIQTVLNKKKTTHMKAAIKKAKMCGEKITENVIVYYGEDDQAIDSLQELLNLVTSWVAFLQDLYFICGQSNKNVGNLY